MPKPAKRKRKSNKPEPVPNALKGWQRIAAFLSQPVSVAQRSTKEGMPVKRQGRFVTTYPAELTGNGSLRTLPCPVPVFFPQIPTGFKLLTA